jgi:hypothetical protein
MDDFSLHTSAIFLSLDHPEADGMGTMTWYARLVTSQTLSMTVASKAGWSVKIKRIFVLSCGKRSQVPPFIKGILLLV